MVLNSGHCRSDSLLVCMYIFAFIGTAMPPPPHEGQVIWPAGEEKWC